MKLEEQGREVKRKSINIGNVFTYALLVIGLIIILFPFYITIITSFKTTEESAANFFAFPKSFYLENFKAVVHKANYFTYFSNSIIITIVAVLFILLFTPMCSYAISRNMNRSKYHKFVYYYLLLGIFVPFQVVMVPLVKYTGSLHLNNQFGLVLLHITFASSQAVFLLVNYIRSVPSDLESAALIDGCTIQGAYWKIVLPLIKPMLMTVLVLNTMWIWNDFQMSLLILNKSPNTWTIPLFQYNFKSQYTFDYNMAFASYLIAMIPIIIVYALMQKYIVSGLTQGAVKS
jgi:raffinose/stachyose/melibiose transport system permease protein